ncbi:MAG TPA: SRPBCC family protein [Acidimicrobiia bacterium]|nr:SRPBCC family protein [Acidimicrobiia bacterium]
MAAIQVAVFIPAPPETVWADLSHLDNHVEWMADAETLRYGGDLRGGVGTTIEVVTRVGPFRTVDVMTFTIWEPPRQMAVAHRGLFTGEGRFVLEPTPGGTRFLWIETIRFPWYLGGPLGALVARPILRTIWRGNLRRLAARFG